MSRPWSSWRDARRWTIVALVGATATARGDERPRPKRPDPGDLFGRKPKKPIARCPDATALPCPRRDGDAPALVVTELVRPYLRRLPLGPGALGTVAGLAVGAGRDDAGVFVGGATGVDTRWTVDGAPLDAPFTGGLGLDLPLAFVDRVAIGTAGFGAASAVGVGGEVDARLRRGGERVEVEADAYLAWAPAAAWLPRTRDLYAPFRGKSVGTRSATATGVVTGPGPRLAGGRTWYAVGVAPTVSDGSLDREALRRRDGDGDGEADRDARGFLVHESIGTLRRTALGLDVPWLARAGFDAAHHAVELTAVGTAAQATRWLVAAETDAAGVDRTTWAGSASATWRGRWGHTTARVQGAWYRSDVAEAPRTAAGAAPAIADAYVPAVDEAPVGAAGDQAVRAACGDGADDPYPLLANCPLPTGFYQIGGVGRLQDLVIDRPSVSAELARVVGEHRLAVGVAGDDVRAVQTTRFSGGTLRQALGPGAYLDYRLVELGPGPDLCAGAPCTFLDEKSLTYRTRTVAAYLVDTWRPAPVVAVEYGVRVQQSQLGTVLRLREALPRVGAAWDFLGGGRSRLFVGWGRLAAPVVAGMGPRVYPSPTLLQAATFAGSTDESLGGTGGVTVADDPRGTRVDAAVVGVEVGQPDVVRLGVAAEARHLGRALDDSAGLLGAAGATDGAVATREFAQVATWLDGAPTAKLGVRLGYAWSRLRGNYPGPIDPVEGLTLGTSTLFGDGRSAAYADATGALPGDQPHRFFAELALRGRWHGLALDGAVRATAASGRVRSARGAADQLVLPRGALGRLAPVTQTNLRLGLTAGRWRATVDVLNLFDRRGVLAVAEGYTRVSGAIDGGDAGDLVWLKDDLVDGAPARRTAGFARPQRVQAPIAIIVGVRAEL